MRLTFKEIKDEISKIVPRNIDYSVDLEAGDIAIFTKDIEAFTQNDGLAAKISKKIKRRIVTRPEADMVMDKEDATAVIKDLVPESANISELFFDPCIWKVIIQCENPSDAVGRRGSITKEIRNKTGWEVAVERTPPILSKTVRDIRGYREAGAEERRKLLRNFGLNIHRPKRLRLNMGSCHCAWLYQEVGRACHFVTTNESRIMIDVGVNIASDTDPMPYFTAPEALPLEQIDAVVLTHAHLDHAGMLPVLFKYGYVACILYAPTRDLMLLLQTDYLKVGGAEGKRAPYDMEDIRMCMRHVVD